MIFTDFELDTILAALYELQGNHEPNDDSFLIIQKLINRIEHTL